MSRTQRNALKILAFLVVVFLLELGREWIVYGQAKRRLEQGYWQLKPGMSKERVREIVGEPEMMKTNGAQEDWYWFARNHRGWLWKTLRLSSEKGHYELNAVFDSQGRMIDVYSAVN